MVIAGIFALMGAFMCLTSFMGNLVTHTRFEDFATNIGIKINKKSPPLPNVTSGEQQITVIQGSYCWDKLGCADHFENYFNVPEEKGIYYYGVSAFWKSSDGKYSEGDTSSAFVVEVK
ncbi:hypothetical protein RAC89_28575 [Paenibacillus sp. GD4]|uniref:hypothetical protein n=1 Tax=Paenibacillus sp. GD4 TaxID=3068890 RepID=UPI00279646C7|nr:hypothetical protein [Paenibacillus sp. GD4]MDQ1914338.1 hypothetical protein [Paenibacillus sp. GD4]